MMFTNGFYSLAREFRLDKVNLDVVAGDVLILCFNHDCTDTVTYAAGGYVIDLTDAVKLRVIDYGTIVLINTVLTL